MIAFAVLPVFAVLVAAPVGPDEACPSARQVTDAMQVRFPASVLVTADPQAQIRPDVLRASLDVAPDGTVVRFSLIDAHGDIQLRRTLPAPGRGQPVTDCLALADTLAAIVERYLKNIGYEAPDIDLSAAHAPVSVIGDAGSSVIPSLTPALPPPPRAAMVLVGFGWRLPAGGLGAEGEIEGRVGAELELNRSTPRAAALLSIGASPGMDAAFGGGPRTATLRRFPARLGASLKLPAGAGWVEPAVALAMDLLVVSSTAGTTEPSSQTVRFGPGVEAAVGYRLKVAGHFHLRPRATIGLAIRRWDIGVQGQPDTMSVFSTPRAYASFGIDTGVLFQ